MKKTSLIFPAILLLFQAQAAYAMDMDYYTYGGFEPIVQAFTRLALIFSDAGYTGLFAVTMVLGIIAGSIAWSVKAATGAQIIPMVWAVPVITGAVFYLALFIPKGNIIVYDQVLNRFQPVGGIPDGVVFTAGMLNKVEKGLVDIIDTASAPGITYSTTAGGVGFKTLASVKGSYPKDNHAGNSMIRYIKDCVTFELMRPGTSLSLDDLRNNNTDFLPLLGQAINPSNFTVYYDSATPSGTNMSCTDAWNHLNPIFSNAGNYVEALKKICGKAQFNANNGAKLQACKDLLTNTLNFTTGINATPERIIQQRHISEILYNFYYQDDVEVAMQMESSRKITSSGLGIGLTMNEWIPIIKAILTAIAIGMIPFLVLFLPTPVFGKALSAMFGFFCWLTIWGVTDAVIHNAAMDYAFYAFEDMKQSALGVYAMSAMPELSTKMMAMFGVIRSAGIMLASMFTMMLVKFGGHALAMMAGNLSGMVQGAGGHAGAILNPEGTSTAMNQQVRAAGLLDGMAEHRFSNQAAAGAFNSVHSPVGNYNSSMNARAALEESGQIPKDTSDAAYAEMQKNFNQQAGTAGGQTSLSLGPDGQATMGKSEGRLSSGSTMTGTTVGAGGAGVQNLNGAWGKAGFTTDGHGGSTLTSASVNGMSPMALARQNANVLTEKASHSFSTNEGWDKLISQVKSDGLTSNEARSFGEKLSNSEASGWDRIINDKSGFTRNLSFDQQESLVGFADAHGGISAVGSGANIGGKYQVTATGADGKTLSFAVDESTAMSVKEAEQDIREKAFIETFGSGQGLQYATSLANKIGATEAASYMKDASNMSRTTETTGADATTAFVRWYANDRGFGDSPEGIDKAGAALNHMATSGSAGMSQLQFHQQRFLRTGNYTWGDGKAQAEAEISATRGEVGGGAGHIQGQVMPGINAASGRTENITSGDFSGHPADRHNPLTSSRVEGQAVLDEAEGIRNSRLEEANQGILMGNRAAYAVDSVIDNADTKMEARLKERASAGKPPLEGD